MSLITRCPACGTMFKVVADQLKISQGWVRCGQCAEVFDAAAHLQPRLAPELPRGQAPVGDTPPVPARPEATEPQAVTPLSTMLRTPEAETPALAPAPEAELPVAPLSMPEVQVSMPEVQVSMPPDLAADVFASSVSLESSAPDLPPQGLPAGPGSDESDAPPPAEPDVSFVRDARRQAFWRQPAMRGLLAAMALLLLLVLVVQVAVVQRNALAVRQPGLHAALQTLCGYMHCEIGPLRQIDSIVIDSSSFNKIAPDVYRLKVAIKNTAAVALAMPSLELTLTDSQDQALLRRVLTPAELGANIATLGAGSEFAGTLQMTVSNPVLPPLAGASAAAPKPPAPLRIAGYRLLTFYP